MKTSRCMYYRFGMWNECTNSKRKNLLGFLCPHKDSEDCEYFKKRKEEKEEELKPCPFCNSDNLASYRSGNSHYIFCQNCGASTNNFPVITKRSEVISAWNRRAK